VTAYIAGLTKCMNVLLYMDVMEGDKLDQILGLLKLS